MRMHLFFLVILFSFNTFKASAEPAPPEPARGLAAIRVPDGFKVEVAATPETSSYPMFMTFDEQGRMFIAESSGKNISGKAMVAAPECLILMLEDTDNDGVFDKKTVFADKLSLPMGVLWFQGSLYVASPPDFIRFDDKNKDGVADNREVLLTGWNVLNTASLHGPFAGPDGWLYLTHGRHGYKIASKESMLFEGLGSRIWRCRPDGTQLDRVMGGGFDNPVEIEFTPAGETIGTMTYFIDPQNGQRDALMHFVEGGVYPKLHESTAEFTRTGELMPTMTKFARIAPAGLMQYRGDHFGPEYKGSLFSAQFNPHRVQRHKLFRDGATYRTEDEDFLTSSDPDFHPTDVLEDADGSVLVSDTGGWYVDACPISRVSKPEVRGTIYRVRREGASTPADPWGKKENFDRKNANKLVAYLDDARPRVRDRAVESLVGLGKKAVAPLARARTNSNSEQTRTLAVWALGRINAAEARDAARDALNDSSPQVRIAAARLAGLSRDPEAGPLLVGLLADPDLGVRRQAATALGYIGDAKFAVNVLEACVGVSDRFVEHALIYTLIQLKQPAPLQAGLIARAPEVRKASLIALDQMEGAPLKGEDFAPFLNEPDPALRATALWIASRHTDWSDLVLAYLEKGIRSDGFTVESSRPFQEIMQAYANDVTVQSMTASLLSDGAIEDVKKLFLLDTIDAASVKAFPKNWEEVLGALLSNRSEFIRDRAVYILRSRGIASFDETLIAMANNPEESASLRLSALSTVATRKQSLTPAEFQFVCAQIQPGNDPGVRQTASKILVYAKLNDEQLNHVAARLIPAADALTYPALLDSFHEAASETTGMALVKALGQTTERLNLVPSQKVDDLIKQFSDSVQAAAKPLRAKAEADKIARIERLSKLEPLLATGDVGRGRRIYFGEKVGCFTCHAVGNEGGNIGPDLTAIGAIRSGHDLLEALLFPSASIVPEYESYNVETEWESYSGIIARQTAETITLKLAVKSTAEIPRKDVRSMEQHPISIMPEGLDIALTQQELLDLMAFLQSLNKESWLLPERREAPEH